MGAAPVLVTGKAARIHRRVIHVSTTEGGRLPNVHRLVVLYTMSRHSKEDLVMHREMEQESELLCSHPSAQLLQARVYYHAMGRRKSRNSPPRTELMTLGLILTWSTQVASRVALPCARLLLILAEWSS